MSGIKARRGESMSRTEAAQITEDDESLCAAECFAPGWFCKFCCCESQSSQADGVDTRSHRAGDGAVNVERWGRLGGRREWPRNGNVRGGKTAANPSCMRGGKSQPTHSQKIFLCFLFLCLGRAAEGLQSPATLAGGGLLGALSEAQRRSTETAA